MKALLRFSVVILLAISLQSCVRSPAQSQDSQDSTQNKTQISSSVDSTEPITNNLSQTQIFTDELVSPFQDWSWGSETTVENGELKVHITDSWGALRPHTGGDTIENVTKVVFRARTVSEGQRQTLNVSFDIDGSYSEAQSITLSNTMQEYTVAHDRSAIVGVAWQDSSGNGLEPFFIDDIYLVIDNSPIAIKEPTGVAEVTLSVNPNKEIGKINPHIYGMSFANPELAKELDLPINRWGGNSTTRYNWEISASNTANDWYFLNVPNGPDDGVDENNLPDTATFNSFIQQNLDSNSETLLTTPMIGWVTKDRNDDCGFNADKYGPQDSTEEPWRPHCGNGYKDGQELYGNSPEDTSKVINENYTKEWLNYINKRYGNEAVQYVALDNEPMLWSSTHRDVYPEPVSYDTIRDLAYRYAPAIKEVSPQAQIFGPVVWGWTAYEYSAKDITEPSSWENPTDRDAHGGKPFLAWYLEQMASYEQENNQRILDYLDIHFYPQQENVTLSDNVSKTTQEARLNSTRTLWDSSYLDDSWINTEVQLIPRMKQLIADEYPDTKLALTEYNWGATKHINGALAQADVLGIFGREGLDMAMFWANPETDDAVSFAFRMFRNFDGQGGKFGDMGVEVGSSQQNAVSIYAAKRNDDTLTIVIVNKSLKDIEVALEIPNTTIEAEVYQYSKQNIKSIENLGTLSLSNTFVLPQDSIRTLVVK